MTFELDWHGQAIRDRLVCDDGTVICWECRAREALIPSLHCPTCLADAWRRLNITNPCCEQREQTEEDKRRLAQPGVTT